MEDKNEKASKPKKPGCEVKAGYQVVVEADGKLERGVVMVVFRESCFVCIFRQPGPNQVIEVQNNAGLYVAPALEQPEGLEVKERLSNDLGAAGPAADVVIITAHPKGGPDLIHEAKDGRYTVSMKGASV